MPRPAIDQSWPLLVDPGEGTAGRVIPQELLQKLEISGAKRIAHRRQTRFGLLLMTRALQRIVQTPRLGSIP